MGERKLVIDHLKFKYEGLFNVEELYTVISSWFFDKGWDWYERMNQEQITPEGKQIHIVLEPWKSTTEFYRMVMKLKINMTDIKDVEVKQNGQILKLSQGVVFITFDGYVVSDRPGQWTSKPFYWFLMIVTEKYLFHQHLEKLETWIKSDLDDLYHKIKDYLNVFKYSYQV